MRIEVVSLFPDPLRAALGFGVVGRALERGLAAVGTVDPREFAADLHRTVDDRPYGGGPGMVGTAEPWMRAIERASERLAARGVSQALRIYLSAQGERLTQRRVLELAALPGWVLVAGRYEGLDERVIEAGIDLELSVGDYVLSGGEFAALVVIDAVVRTLPGALGDARSAEEESFSAGLLDWPHYTRPVEWRGRRVPQVLQEGDHAAIRRWRLKQAVWRTWRRRPDLLISASLDREASGVLNEVLAEREGEEHDQRDC